MDKCSKNKCKATANLRACAGCNRPLCHECAEYVRTGPKNNRVCGPDCAATFRAARKTAMSASK